MGMVNPPDPYVVTGTVVTSAWPNSTRPEPMPPPDPSVSLVLVVHPIDPANHPGADGFRWALHHGHDVSNQFSCLNAGAEDTRDDATLRGQQVGAAASKMLERLGRTVWVTTMQLGYDPLYGPWKTEVP